MTVYGNFYKRENCSNGEQISGYLGLGLGRRIVYEKGRKASGADDNVIDLDRGGGVAVFFIKT